MISMSTDIKVADVYYVIFPNKRIPNKTSMLCIWYIESSKQYFTLLHTLKKKRIKNHNPWRGDENKHENKKCVVLFASWN